MLIELTRLWKHQKPSDGSTFLSGNLGKARLVIFPNKFKEKPEEPDYILYLQETLKKPQEGPKIALEEDIPL